MTKTEQLLAMSNDIYLGNKEKGFWDQERNKGEQIMLIISELGEAVEADRKGRRYSKVPAPMRTGITLSSADTSENIKAEWIKDFELHVKDTVEDELADALIRALDYIGGWGIDASEKYTGFSVDPNFAQQMLHSTIDFTMCYKLMDLSGEEGDRWAFAISHLVAYAGTLDMDILQHVQWKLRYNATRAAKHGKAY